MSHKPSSVNVLPELPFLQLVPDDIRAVRVAIDRVLERGIFELGQEMEAFETEFAGASGSTHCVGVGSGTDALALALRGLGVGPGDEVITTPLTAAFTALAIVMTGAKPVFADIDADRMTLSPSAVANAVSSKTAAIVPVHLYGQAANMPALMAVAARHNLVVVEDCCQAHLATCGGQPVGTFGEAAAFSFYPTKNLGALGDGGEKHARRRCHGQRRRVVLGDMIAIKAGLFGGANELNSLIQQLRQRPAVGIDMVKQSKFHDPLTAPIFSYLPRGRL